MISSPRSAAALMEDAAAGRLPDWAVAGESRVRHMARVAELMDGWAADLGLSGDERIRWRAVAWLHDALRDADPAALRSAFGPADGPGGGPETEPTGGPGEDLSRWTWRAFQGWPSPLLHGPAVAARLHSAGIGDEAVLTAVAYHTVGHPELPRLGRALYLADFLEPGRAFEPAWRGALRARMPAALEAVLVQVVGARLRHLVERRHGVRAETVAFWNSLAERE